MARRRLQQRRSEAQAAAANVNEVKQRIDGIRADLRYAAERTGGAPRWTSIARSIGIDGGAAPAEPETDLVVTEEEMGLLRAEQQARKTYRELFGRFRETRAAAGETEAAAAEAREALLSGFQRWASERGVSMGAEAASSGEAGGFASNVTPEAALGDSWTPLGTGAAASPFVRSDTIRSLGGASGATGGALGYSARGGGSRGGIGGMDFVRSRGGGEMPGGYGRNGNYGSSSSSISRVMSPGATAPAVAGGAWGRQFGHAPAADRRDEEEAFAQMRDARISQTGKGAVAYAHARQHMTQTLR